jgi:DNA-binding MarR family transcriptional regulator
VNARTSDSIPAIDDEALGAWRALLGAHARVTGDVEAALKAAGLPPLAWYDVLWPLQRASPEGLRMGALAAEVTLSRTGLTRLVDRIEERGLLRRRPVPEDRRGSYVRITPAGTAMLRRMWPVYERVLAETFVTAVQDPRALRRQLAPLARRSRS